MKERAKSLRARDFDLFFSAMIKSLQEKEM
jgi:hypothetical protein